MIVWEMDHDFWVPPFSLAKRIYFKLINKVDRIITVSQTQKKRMIDHGVDPEKITVIRNFIDTKEFSPHPNKIDSNYILYVAKFAERKNQLLLLEAFKKIEKEHPHLKLYLVGPKSGAFTSKKTKGSPYYQRCLKYIRKYSLEEKVKIFENLSDEELIELYRDATLFVFPSYEEAFGMTLLEAMACGCCCLVNNIDTSLEIIGDARVAVNVNDSAAFAGQMELLLNNKALRKQIEEKARQRAVKVFDSKVAREQFKTLLKGIANLNRQVSVGTKPTLKK